MLQLVLISSNKFREYCLVLNVNLYNISVYLVKNAILKILAMLRTGYSCLYGNVYSSVGFELEDSVQAEGRERCI